MIDELQRLLNRNIRAALQQYAARTEAVKIEILKLEREAGNLVQFLAEGNESAAVRERLETTESAHSPPCGSSWRRWNGRQDGSLLRPSRDGS